MSGVELGLAIAATIDLCFKYGNSLVRVCASIEGAEAELSERVLCVEICWKRTSLQLDFLRGVWDSLDNEHQILQKQVLEVLVGKLTTAVSKIESFIVPTTGVKRWKFALLRDGFDKTIEDLDKWQKMFDPSWYLMLRTSNLQIDTQFAKYHGDSASSLLNSTQMLRNTLRGNPQEGSIFRSADGLQSASILDIPFSASKVAHREGSSKRYILDSVCCPVQGNVQWLTRDVRELAEKLRHAEPSQFGLLKCHCVIRERLPQNTRQISFTFMFETVEGLSIPQSLRACLLAGETCHSLSDRLAIAKELARSISFVHTFGFVHKNVRPENILIATNSPALLGHSFLVGFEEFRIADGHTLRYGDSSWEKNMYRHPRRQGPRPDDYYIMQHDIYSLGVCLLEIGLWESFALYNNNGACLPSLMISALMEGLATWEPVLMKDVLVSLTRTVLPRRMGTKYTRVVETCLTCLDAENTDFGDEHEFQDADGVLVGVRYIDKVLLELENISM